jgi:5-formyltetrahydrofolate cyclo-ligase
VDSADGPRDGVSDDDDDAAAPAAAAGAKAAKVTLRAERRAERRSLSVEERAAASASIAETVLGLDIVTDAVTVHLYLPTPFEVDTRIIAATLLLEGRRVVVPVGDDLQAYELALEDLDSLAVGDRGVLVPPVLRPVPAGWWDVVLVPLVAFDRAGHRLGQGGGYYDRLLSNTLRPTVGLAFDVQQVPSVPVEPHDCPLDVIVTESGLFGPTAQQP